MTDPATPHRIQRRRKLHAYTGNLDGRNTAIMACHSFAEFRAATSISRDFGERTDHPGEVKQAMSEPGVVFVRDIMAGPGDPWRKRND